MICAEGVPALRATDFEEPAVCMALSVYNSEFIGREGKFVAFRNFPDRLRRRQVGPVPGPDAGALQDPRGFLVCTSRF